MIHYGFPERLLSDQGRDFESQLIHELCALAGIKKVRTSPYHPRGNPVERFNRTLLGMLGTLKEKEKSHWRDYVKPLTHAYNCTKSDVTGFSPYELMFGRRPRLPVDIAFGLPVQGGAPKSHSQYVKNLKARLEESYQIVTKNSAKVAERNKCRFDKVVRESTLQEGDRVLVRNLRLRNKHKLADKWESTVYKVLKRKGDLPVYTVQPINADGPTRTLHRDHLLPCGNLIDDEEPEQVNPKVCRPRTRSRQSQSQEDYSESEDDSCDCPVRLSVIPEKRFIQVCELPRGQHSPVNLAAEGDCSLANPTNFQPQGELVAGNSPTSLAETGEILPDSALEESEVATEQAPMENDTTEPDLNRGNMATADSDNSLVCQEELEHGEVIGESQWLNSKPTRDIVDQDKNEKDEQLIDTDIDDPDLTTRRSERLRRPPKRFYYDELGKPLISFAKSLLESFNRALDTMGDDSSLVVQRNKHEGTHADLRREGVTHIKNQVTNPVYVI